LAAQAGVQQPGDQPAGPSAVDEVRRWLAAGVPVGPHLADQLLVPLALAGGRFRTLKLSRHTETTIAVIEQFVGAKITTVEISRAVWEIGVSRA